MWLIISATYLRVLIWLPLSLREAYYFYQIIYIGAALLFACGAFISVRIAHMKWLLLSQHCVQD